MAFAKWQYPYTLTAEQAAEKKELDEGMEPWPEGANVELCDEFWGKLKAGREKWIERDKDFCELFLFFFFLCAELAGFLEGFGLGYWYRLGS